MLKETLAAIGMSAIATATVLPTAVAAPADAGATKVLQACNHCNPCNPCNPCAAHPCGANPCAANPCAANPCAANPCSPCGAESH